SFQVSTDVPRDGFPIKGKVTTKVAPRCRALPRTIDPPDNEASSRAIHKPSPYPAIVLSRFMARPNFSKIRLRWCSSIPGPESLTRTTALPALSASALISTGAPSPYFKALETSGMRASEIATSTAARRLDCGDVDLFHRHHRFERTLGRRA